MSVAVLPRLAKGTMDLNNSQSLAPERETNTFITGLSKTSVRPMFAPSQSDLEGVYPVFTPEMLTAPVGVPRFSRKV